MWKNWPWIGTCSIHPYLSLVMGKEANYMGTRVSGLEIKHWKSGEVLCKMLLFLVVDKYESEGYKRKY